MGAAVGAAFVGSGAGGGAAGGMLVVEPAGAVPCGAAGGGAGGGSLGADVAEADPEGAGCASAELERRVVMRKASVFVVRWLIGVFGAFVA